MKFRLVAVLLLGLVTAGATAPSPSLEEEVLALTRELLEHIYVEPSADFYAAHVDPDVTAYEGPPLRVDGIAYHLFALRRAARGSREGEERYFELLQPKVQLLGDAAVVTGTTRVTVVRDGTFTNTFLQETRVWARRGGRWRLVHFHKSPVRWPAED
ncbi:MAG: DUF4440 domain-containing protein [Terriglobia bacterium]